jgi:cytochrome c-type biogenesis protein CcsB
MNVQFFYISLSIYIFSTLFYLLYFAFNRYLFERIGFISLFSALVTHFISLLLRYFEGGYTPITNIYESLSFFALCIGAFFIFVRHTYGVHILGSFIVPAISFILAISAFLDHDIRPIPPYLKSYYLPIHAAFSFIGNGIFFTSFIVSLLYLIVENYIKKKKIPFFAMRLPSLELLDRINVRCISIGFPFLTLGIISGSVWASLAWGSYWSWDPKEVWSLITWLIYAIVIHRRLIVGWKGRKTAFMMIIGFFSILITFIGVNYFMGGKHSYL